MIETMRTDDYSIFKTLEGNRPVEERRVQHIIESIQSVGWVSNPIIVNENMEVIDGQGRLEALIRLKMPVEYRVVPGASIRQCRQMNSVGEQWKNKNFVKSYADTGNKSYQRLLQMMEMYDVDLYSVLRLMNRRSHDDSYTLKSGEFYLSNDDFGKGLKRLPIYTAYMKVMKRFSGFAGTKKKVVFFLIEHGGYPHQLIIDALTKCDPNEIHCSGDERLVESIEDVFNKYKRDDKKIYFLADYRRSGK